LARSSRLAYIIDPSGEYFIGGHDPRTVISDLDIDDDNQRILVKTYDTWGPLVTTEKACAGYTGRTGEAAVPAGISSVPTSLFRRLRREVSPSKRPA
jgi:hypothetical protein